MYFLILLLTSIVELLTSSNVFRNVDSYIEWKETAQYLMVATSVVAIKEDYFEYIYDDEPNEKGLFKRLVTDKKGNKVYRWKKK